MLYEFPIKYYEDNLIFTDNGCWACYELVGYDYDNRSVSEKLKILRDFSNFIGDVVSEMKIHVIPARQEYADDMRNLYKRMPDNDPLKKVAKQYAEEHIKYLEAKNVRKIYYDENGNKRKVLSDNNDDFRFYFEVKLEELNEKDYIKKIKDALEYLIVEPKRAINSFLGIEEQRIIDSKIRAFKKASNQYFETQSQRVAIRQIDDKIIQWLYRRINYRGLASRVGITNFVPKGNKILTETGEMAIEPVPEEISCLFKGKIKQKDRYLEVTTDAGTSYQTFLSLCERPTMSFPGSEFVFMLQKINANVEACIHITMLDKLTSEKAVLAFRKKISSEIENANEGNIRIDDNTREAIVEVEHMGEEVRVKKALAKVSVTFVVASDTLEDMENMATQITNIYKDNEIIFQRSVADQYKLYLECIPGANRYTEDYTRINSIESIAGMGIGATSLLGDQFGPYIGTTGSMQKKVFLDMSRAPLENKSASATFYGDLGYGKSFNANLLLLLQVIYGGYALIFDPKSERSEWGNKLPFLKNLITITNLSADNKFKGMLDPFIIYSGDKDVEEACSLAQGIVAELCKLNPKDEEYIALKEALVSIKSRQNRSMTLLTEILEKAAENSNDEFSKAYSKLARTLKTLKDIGMTKLLFGEGHEKALNFDNRINILQISNLKMPSEETPKEDYSDEEVTSSVLMMVMSHFAKKFAQSYPNKFKVILFDESWFLKGTAEGLKLYEFLTRMGRSLFCACIFNGHSVLDIPSEKIQNTISYKFCFHTDEAKEAERMCNYLKIDPSKENIDHIMQLQNRECMFRDLDGRVGKLKFDAVFGNVIDCFSTTPITDEAVL